MISKRRLLLYKLSKRYNDLKARLYTENDASAMGDLAFLLLIFFIVTSSFLSKQGIVFQQAKPDEAPHRVLAEKVIEIIPQQEGYQYRGSLLDSTALMKKIIQDYGIKANQKHDFVAVISLDGSLPYERLLAALSLCKKLNLAKVSVKKT